MTRHLAYLLLFLSLSTMTHVAAAAQLGRLFLAPETRATLEKARQSGTTDNKGVSDSAPAYAPVEGDQIISLDGFVKQSGSGKTTTWINSIPQHGHENPQGVTVLPSKTLPGIGLRLPSGQSIRLQAGQSVDGVTGQIREGYESGTIQSTPNRTSPIADRP